MELRYNTMDKNGAGKNRPFYNPKRELGSSPDVFIFASTYIFHEITILKHNFLDLCIVLELCKVLSLHSLKLSAPIEEC